MPLVVALRASWCPGGAVHGSNQGKENYFSRAAAAERKAGALPRRCSLTFKKQILTQSCL